MKSLLCMCVQRIRATVEKEERRRLLRELNVCMDSKHCPYTITFYGAMFGEVKCCYVVL